MTTAAGLLKRATDLDPALPDAHLFLALALSKLDQRDRSGQMFQRAIELDPFDGIAVTAFADTLSDWGRDDDAEALFEKILKKRSTNQLALRWYARHLLFRSTTCDDEDARKAIDLLERSLSVCPDSAQGEYLLGLAYSFLNDCQQEARTHLLACLRLAPDHEKAAQRLAELSAPG